MFAENLAECTPQELQKVLDELAITLKSESSANLHVASVSTILADGDHHPHAQPRAELYPAQTRRTQFIALSHVLADRAGDAVEGLDLI